MCKKADSKVGIDILCNSVQRRFKHFFQCFGYAHADYTYSESTQRMYDYLLAMPHRPVYVRMHSILTCSGTGDACLQKGSLYGETADIVSFDPAGKMTCNWATVDRVYDFLINNGFKPIVELHRIPPVLQRQDVDYLPHNWQKWRKFVSAFTGHCLERYGLKEVRSWYFELYNEVMVNWKEPPYDDLFRLYDYSVQSVLDAEDSLRVGGPTTTQRDHEYPAFRAFLDHCLNGTNYATGKKGTRLDFVAVHVKGGFPPRKGEHPDSDLIMGDLRRFISIIREFPRLKDVPFFNDEADPAWNGNLGIKDFPWANFRNTHYFPVFVCKMLTRYCYELEDELGVNIEVMCSDNGHIGWEPYTFSGNRSQVTRVAPHPCSDLIKKPVMNVHHMLGKLGRERLRVKAGILDDPHHENGVLATREGPGYLAVLLYNMNDRIDAEGDKVFELRLKDMPVELNRGRLIHYRIDSRHSGAYAEFERLGSPRPLTREQAQSLRNSQDLRMYEPVSEIEIKNGVFCKDIVMPMHSASLLVLVPKTTRCPRRPSSLSAKEEKSWFGNARVVLRWAPNSERDFTHFELERGKKPAGPYERLNQAGELNTGMYFDEGIEPGTAYFYRVRAVNASGMVSEWSEIDGQ